MVTTNRQIGVNGSESGENDVAGVTASSRVAMLTGLKKKKDECRDLNPREWVQLVNIVLKRTKSRFPYIPYFKAAVYCDFKTFFLKRVSTTQGDCHEGLWQDDHLYIANGITGAIADGKIKPLLGTNRKMLEVCEITLDDVREITLNEKESKIIKVMLDTNGTFILFHCTRSRDLRSSAYDAEVVSGDKTLELLFTSYPQVGWSTLYAIASMFEDDFIEKRSRLEKSAEAGRYVLGICDKLTFEGCRYSYTHY